ncbi:MAG: hypothetical protein JBO36_04960 [Candidatus Thiodiazotropha taylori]|nr:hypothetical protein [Candidatus Thiodiazotropha taylori]
MKKLYKLKTWFSLSDAAERLSASLEEEVSVKDVLQLAIEGALPISCYVRDLPARRYPPQTNSDSPSPPEDSITNKNNKLKRKINIVDSTTMVATEENTLGYKVTDFLKGPYKIRLDNCDAIKDWLYGLITKSDSEIGVRDGFFLSDEEGNTWQVLEYADHLVLAMPNGEKVIQGSQYLPCYSFPIDSDLIVQRQHIEIFEESLLKSTKNKSIHPRTETSHLNIIAALLEVIENGIPNADTPDGRLGPISGLKSKAMLVNTIAHRYESVPGLSKRTLNQKLLDARKSLENSY